MNKLFVMLFAGLLSGVAGAGELVEIPTPCFESKQLTALLNKNKAKRVASQLTQDKELVFVDSIWYTEDSILSLREFRNHGKTCVLSVINHKGEV